MFSRCCLSRLTAAVELRVVEGVRVRDAELLVVRHQVDGRVGDVDLVVVGGDLALVGRATLEDHAPRIRGLGHDGRVEHQQVRAATVRDAVRDAVDGVVRLVLEAIEDVRVVGDLGGVDRRDVAAGDEAQGRVTRRGDAVVLTGLHQLDHLGRAGPDLDRGLAAGRGLERGDPVVAAGRDGLAARAAHDVLRPGDEVELALALADGAAARGRTGRACRRRRAGRRAGGRRRGRRGAVARTRPHEQGDARQRRRDPSISHRSSSSARLRGAINRPHPRWGVRAVASRSGGQPCLAARAPRSRTSRDSAG